LDRIGIIAAMRAELLPLVREWPRTDQVFITEQGNRQYFAACEGIGAAAATRSFAALRVAAGELDAVISYGWAGALSCGLKPPGVHVVGEVIDARTGERFATDTPHGGMQNGREAPLRLVTLDHVARKDEKRALADRYKAVMVDMEAATVGRLARAHGMKFLCLRGISDGYLDELPDLNRFITPGGQMRTLALALHATMRPGTWGALMELGRNSREAAEGLARAFPSLFLPPPIAFPVQ
jgi:adenosylhomocysteine nucleosidase